MTRLTVPLDRLEISDLNVRKTDREIDIEQLADDIAAKGLLQNLVVVPERGPGLWGVVAGGRRLLALKLLAECGTIKPNHSIPVVTEKHEDGRECSLAENLHKVGMNPADEFEAFAAIVADYEARGIADPQERIERCARHFGETPRHIEQRLRLAALHPDILDALRAGEIKIESARAYAAYPDQKWQREIFVSQSNPALSNAHSVHAIRAALAGKVYHLGDRHVRYVGVDAYLAAGGRMERELFMGAEDQDVLLDTALLDRLFADKAAVEGARLARDAGYAGAEVALWPAPAYPVVPKGFTFIYGIDVKLAAAEKSEAVLYCRIGDDGAAIVPTGNGFARLPEPSRAGSRAAAPISSSGQTRPRQESELERLARMRREAIEATALRLAVPKVAGTPLEGRTYWPDAGQRMIEAVQRDEDGNLAIAIYVTVTAAELDRVRAAAEREYDRRESERAAERAGLASAVDAVKPADPLDREPEWPLHEPTADRGCDIGPIVTEGATPADAGVHARELEPSL